MAEMLVESWTDMKGTCKKVYRENPGISQDEFIHKVEKETEGSRIAAHLATATAVGLVTGEADDVNRSSQSAQTALNKNFLPCAVMIASMAWSTYKTYNMACTMASYWEAYKTGGADAVMKILIF